MPPRIGGVEHYTGWLASALRDTGVHVRVLAANVPGNDFADVRVPCRLLGGADWPLVLPTRATRRAIRAEVRRADAVIIQNYAHTLCLLAAIAARFRRRPAITVVHTAQPSTGGSPAYRAVAWLYDRTATMLTFLIAPPAAFSSSARRFVRRRFGFRARELTYPLEVLDRGSREPASVVWVGRLSREKAPELAIRAVERAREVSGGDLRLELYGDGPERTSIDRMASDRGWVRVHGAVTRDEVRRAQVTASVVLSSSRQESLGIVVLESLSAGVPVVASRLGDIAEHLGSDLVEYAVEAPAGTGDAWVEMAAEMLVRSLDERTAEEFQHRATHLRDTFDQRRAIDSVLRQLRIRVD